jgi:hypothetical protein
MLTRRNFAIGCVLLSGLIMTSIDTSFMNAALLGFLHAYTIYHMVTASENKTQP